MDVIPYKCHVACAFLMISATYKGPIVGRPIAPIDVRGNID